MGGLLTNVVLLHLADVSVERAVTEDDEHYWLSSIRQEVNNVSRMTHHCILLFSSRGQQLPRMIPCVKHPQLRGHVPRGINLPTIHVYLILRESHTHMHKGKTENLYVQSVFSVYYILHE